MKYFYVVFLLLTGFCWLTKAAITNSLSPNNKKTDFLLRADQISHEKDLGVVIARGNVKISDGIEIIEADMVSYNEKLNIVSASGHVRFYDQIGNVTHSNYLEITKDLKDGFAEKVYLLTQEKERFSAKSVTKTGEVLNFEKGTYSPCAMCEGETVCQTPPIWQLRASKIKKDNDEKTISYQDVFFDFKGVPVFYCPYLTHPDPSVKRKDGVLMPFLGNTTSLGMILGVPYYMSPTPSQEVIIRPVLMTKDSPMLSGSYRQLFLTGALNLSGSVINTTNITGTAGSLKKNQKKTHGHIIGSGLLDLNENWRANAKIERVSSPTYFKKYYFLESEPYRTKNYLDSSLRFEGFYDKNYLAFEGVDFQNLRSDVRNDTVPFAVPVIVGSYSTNPGEWGEFWSADLNQSYIDRERGARVGRLSTTGTFFLPYLSNGVVHEFKTFVRGDAYDVKKHTIPGRSSRTNQGSGRLIPGAAWTMKYPLVKAFNNENRLIVEPMLMLVALPNGLNDPRYPNEDCQNFEFDSVHLMQAQRFGGFDKVDDGQRINYGANINLYSKSRAILQFFGGQSYSFSKTNHFDAFSGVQKGFSDYVGRITYSPNDLYKATWSFRLGQKSLKPKRNTVELSGGPSLFRVTLGYTQTHRSFFQNQYVRREQLMTTISSQFHTNWTASINQSREFGFKKGELQHGAGLVYQDDCFKARFDFFRTFYQDRDIVPSQTFMLTIGLKNLGEYSTGNLSLNRTQNTGLLQQQP